VRSGAGPRKLAVFLRPNAPKRALLVGKLTGRRIIRSMPKHRRGHHEGSIRKRKDGRWEATYRVAGDRRYITGRKGEGRAEVTARLHEALTKSRSGLPMVQYRDSFGAFLDSWLESVKVSRAAKTHESYSDTVRLHIKPVIGAVPLRRVSPADVQRAMTAAMNAELSMRTVAYVRSIIRRALHVAQSRGLISSNAAEFVAAPKVPRTALTIPLEDEWKAFLAAIDGHPYRALFLVLAVVGMRRGESLGLSWRDFDGKSIRISRALLRVKIGPKKGALKLLDVKTSTSRRAIKLPPIITDAIRQWRTVQKGWKLAAADVWTDSDLMFTTRIGTPVDPRNAKRLLDRVLSKAKLPHRTIHQLRHIAVSNLLAAGVPLEVVSSIVGHSSIRVTKDVYGHVVPALMDAAAEKMEQIGRR
jgi:integrase